VSDELPAHAVPDAGPTLGGVPGTVLPGDAVDGRRPGTTPGGGSGSTPGGGHETRGGHGTGDGTGRRRRPYRWIVEWIVVILVAVGVAFGVRAFVAQTYYVPSTSMWPTLKAGDRIVVNKLYGTIHVGDIIVFKRPPAENCGGPPVPDLVKRVIGLPGQTVSAHAGQVFVTGKPLKEPWLPKGPQTYTKMSKPFTVPKGDYFVMGDNRVNSCDSRTWGPVKSSYVVGKVFLILWPPSQFRYF
jgi:signal peptidase I